MCEFRVYLDGEMVMRDVIFAAVEGDRVTVRDVIGESQIYEGVIISEVNVPATRLVLRRV
jgi:predicted RNA-binding protein